MKNPPVDWKTEEVLCMTRYMLVCKNMLKCTTVWGCWKPKMFTTTYLYTQINLLSSNLNQSVYSSSKRRHSNIFPAVSQSLNVSKGSSITFEAPQRPNTSRKLSPFSPNTKQTKLADGSYLLKTETTKVLNQALKPPNKTSFKPSLLKPTDRLSKGNLLNKPAGLVKRKGNATNALFRYINSLFFLLIK